MYVLAVIAATVVQLGAHALSITPPDGWKVTGAVENGQWSGTILAPSGASLLVFAAVHDVKEGPLELGPILVAFQELATRRYPNLKPQGKAENGPKNGYPGAIQPMGGDIADHQVGGVAGVIDGGNVTIMYLFVAPQTELAKDLTVVGKSMGSVLVDGKKGPWPYPEKTK
jgi:hypothetical protein